MSALPQARVLPDGKRLHLHHGPIDLIIGVEGADRQACFQRATARFQTVLTGLAADLPVLRRQVTPLTCVRDQISRRMVAAVRPFADVFCTPMAAVAGAVAEEMLEALIAGVHPTKAYVNNGGDVAFFLSEGTQMTSLGPTGELRIEASDAARGLATSGWQGRSHSLGIADAVTVAAPTAAQADIAATLIANAVTLGPHPAVQTRRAEELNPDSDLGARRITTDVGPLAQDDIRRALKAGADYAQTLCDRGLICQAALLLQGHHLCVTPQPCFQGEPLNA